MKIDEIIFKEKVKINATTNGNRVNQIIINLPQNEKLSISQQILLISFLEKL